MAILEPSLSQVRWSAGFHPGWVGPQHSHWAGLLSRVPRLSSAPTGPKWRTYWGETWDPPAVEAIIASLTDQYPQSVDVPLTTVLLLNLPVHSAQLNPRPPFFFFNIFSKNYAPILGQLWSLGVFSLASTTPALLGCASHIRQLYYKPCKQIWG